MSREQLSCYISDQPKNPETVWRHKNRKLQCLKKNTKQKIELILNFLLNQTPKDRWYCFSFRYLRLFFLLLFFLYHKMALSRRASAPGPLVEMPMLLLTFCTCVETCVEILGKPLNHCEDIFSHLILRQMFCTWVRLVCYLINVKCLTHCKLWQQTFNPQSIKPLCRFYIFGKQRTRKRNNFF